MVPKLIVYITSHLEALMCLSLLYLMWSEDTLFLSHMVSLFAAGGLHSCMWPEATSSRVNLEHFIGVNLEKTGRQCFMTFSNRFWPERKNKMICHPAKFYFFSIQVVRLLISHKIDFFEEKFRNNFFKSFWSSESNAIIHFTLNQFMTL